MEWTQDTARRMDSLLNVAAAAWPGGVVFAFCLGCGKEREYNWDWIAKIMQRGGLPKHCGDYVELRAEGESKSERIQTVLSQTKRMLARVA